MELSRLGPPPIVTLGGTQIKRWTETIYVKAAHEYDALRDDSGLRPRPLSIFVKENRRAIIRSDFSMRSDARAIASSSVDATSGRRVRHARDAAARPRRNCAGRIRVGVPRHPRRSRVLPAVRKASADTLIVADGSVVGNRSNQGAGRRAVHLAQALQAAIAGRRDGDWLLPNVRVTSDPYGDTGVPDDLST